MLDPGQQPSERFSAFISYCRRNRQWATWLQSEIESYTLPPHMIGRVTGEGPVPRRFLPVFLDRSDLTAGPDLVQELKRALSASRWLVVLCSPEAAQSQWVEQEVRLMQELGREDRILAALFAGDEHSAFPPSLRAQGIPLAADFRKEGDGRHLAFLKLVAAMSGVELGELILRDRARMIRRVGAIAGGSVMGMAAFAGVALYALSAKAEAEAERARSEAMVGALVTDLRQAVKPMGSLAILGQVNEIAGRYFRGQSIDSMPDSARAERAKLLIAMGQDDLDRGDYAAARAQFEEAHRTTGARLAAAPDDTQRLFDHAQSEFWLGSIAVELGHLPEARQRFESYNRLAAALVAREPGKPDWQMEAGYAAINLGTVALRQEGRAADAERMFAGALARFWRAQALGALPANVQPEAATALAWLADAQRANGHVSEALVTRSRQVKLLDKLIGERPDDIALAAYRATATLAMGRDHLALGEVPEAVNLFREAEVRSARLARLDPESRAAAYQLRMSGLFRAWGELALARASRPPIGDIEARIGTCSDPAGPSRRTVEVTDFCRLVRARARLITGDREGARALLDDVRPTTSASGALSEFWGIDFAAETRRLEREREDLS